MSELQEDTLAFSLQAETTVTNTTVKVSAEVAVVIDGTVVTKENLADQVKAALERFIPGANWHLSNPRLTVDDANMERASVTATARVPDTENFSLKSRSEAASRPGLAISEFYTDTSNPAGAIREASSSLRVKLIEQAQAEADMLSKASGRDYRVKALNFSAAVDGSTNNMMKGLRASETTFAASSYAADSASSGGGSLGHTQKLVMSATIMLATNVPTLTPKKKSSK